MRITNGMMASQFLYDANKSLSRLAQAQKTVDSTKKISNIADDPIATVNALKARNKLSSLANYQSNVSTADEYLSESSDALDSINTLVSSAQALVDSANSGSKNDSDLSAIAEEMASLRDEVLSVSNSSLGSVYLFSGNSSSKPFSVNSAGHLIYNSIDMTQLSDADDLYDAQSAIALDKSDIAELAGTGASSTGYYAPDISDYYAKNTITSGIINDLDDMLNSANSALSAATDFGDIGTSALSSFVSQLKAIKTNLENESNKTVDLSDVTTNPDKSSDLFSSAATVLKSNTTSSGTYTFSAEKNALGVTVTATGDNGVTYTASVDSSALSAAGSIALDFDGGDGTGFTTTLSIDTSCTEDEFVSGVGGMNVTFSDHFNINTVKGQITALNALTATNLKENTVTSVCADAASGLADGTYALTATANGDGTITVASGSYSATISLDTLEASEITQSLSAALTDGSGNTMITVNLGLTGFTNDAAGIAALAEDIGSVSTPGISVTKSGDTVTAAAQGTLTNIASEMAAATAGDRTALANETDAAQTIQIGRTQTVSLGLNGIELLGSGNDNIYTLLDRCVDMLNGGDTSGLSNVVSSLQNAQSRVLAANTKVGASQERMSIISERYSASKITYKGMQSDAEDADMAEAITNFKTAKTVYSAALAGGAAILQTSLVDFLS